MASAADASQGRRRKLLSRGGVDARRRSLRARARPAARAKSSRRRLAAAAAMDTRARARRRRRRRSAQTAMAWLRWRPRIADTQKTRYAAWSRRSAAAGSCERPGRWAGRGAAVVDLDGPRARARQTRSASSRGRRAPRAPRAAKVEVGRGSPHAVQPRIASGVQPLEAVAATARAPPPHALRVPRPSSEHVRRACRSEGVGAAARRRRGLVRAATKEAHRLLRRRGATATSGARILAALRRRHRATLPRRWTSSGAPRGRSPGAATRRYAHVTGLQATALTPAAALVAPAERIDTAVGRPGHRRSAHATASATRAATRSAPKRCSPWRGATVPTRS